MPLAAERAGDQASVRLDGSWTRRELLGALGGLALGGLPWRRSVARPPDQPLGIQLYTVRELLSRDFEGTLANLARIGYWEVEFAGLHGQRARDVRAMLDRLGLRAPGAHYGLPDIQDTLDRTIAEAKALGLEYVIVPWLPEDSRTRGGFARIAETFNKAGEKLRAVGLRLGYHNHDFEFAELKGGGIGYDVLLEKTDPALVWMELDLFWIRKGGRDALRYFRSYPDRFRLVHIKDMAADGSMTDIGMGAMDWAGLLGAARQAGVRHFIAEHDAAADPLRFAKTSFEYLSALKF